MFFSDNRRLRDRYIEFFDLKNIKFFSAVFFFSISGHKNLDSDRYSAKNDGSTSV
jgi:hypothetical protein